MNKSEGKGYKWLLKQGYKEGDVVFQTKGIDFICADGKGYEVKRLYSHVIWFHEGQLERTRGVNNIVLVFDDDKEEPIATIPSMELEKDKVISGIKITVVNTEQQGYSTIRVKEEVIAEIRERTKASGLKSMSVFLRRLLEEELKSSTDAVSESSKDAVTEKGEFVLSEADIKKIAGQMELAIGMYIESGIAKGVKELR